MPNKKISEEQYMKLYHGSNTGGIRTLGPRPADHDRPYIYMTTIEVVSAFYICNAVERPFYWFPYGFTQSGTPIYHELYPNALKEVSLNRRGYLYEVNANENQIIPFKNIPCARLATSPLQVCGCTEIPNAYNYFLKCVDDGKLEIGRFEDKSESERKHWYKMIYTILKEKDMANTPDCSYARFVQNKFPQVWQQYINEESKRKKY